MKKAGMNRALEERARELAERSYPFIVTESEGEFEITFPDLRGCRTSGKSLEEVIANIDEAKLTWVEGTLICGGSVPDPSDNFEYSGRFVLRCSRGLHKALSQLAVMEGVSLNQFIVQALSEKVGHEQARKSYQKAWDDVKTQSSQAEIGGSWPHPELKTFRTSGSDLKIIRQEVA